MADITVEKSLDDSELQLVHDGMSRYTRAHVDYDSYERITITLRDENKTLKGAALGEAGRGWLKISIIWVDEAFRGKGHGTRLLAGIEREAIKKGCFNACLDTFSYQAKPFYERYGYEVFGTLDDYPVGHQRFFMRKSLQSRD